MTSRRDFDPAEAAQITQRIDQFFNFMRDAVDDPRIFETMPDDSTLAFRDLVHEGQFVRLTAFLAKQPGACWGARVSGAVPLSTPLGSRGLGNEGPSVSGFDTAEAALDALEAEISAVGLLDSAARRAVGT